ncbi:tumor protein D53 isoform X10 [Salmo salar]|uniref:Tumor protein D53 isoform X10 n=1 Tax=Salmo salar TaxID=8030 RepID=A0A1S3S776_SALSA|nr:tumor protein D53 isoform X10 [Salmo salar]|eukprot:XP_014060192.1 PREDICTED: tumor protein D53 isoform X10 [Salmo salar]
METRQQGMAERTRELYSSVLSDYSSVLSDGAGEWGKTSYSDEWVMPSGFEVHLQPEERGQGHLRTGLLDPEPLTEVDEEMVSEVDLYNTVTDEEREEILSELTKLEEEISTLRQVLASKEKHHSDLKAKLGITPLSELKQNFNRSWYDMQTSTAYKKTSETLSTAGQKTSAAFTTLGTAISRKFGDMRNSPSFKSFEEKVESTVSNIKTKVGSQGGGGSFEEVLSSAAHASAQETPSNNLSESSDHERTC